MGTANVAAARRIRQRADADAGVPHAKIVLLRGAPTHRPENIERPDPMPMGSGRSMFQPAGWSGVIASERSLFSCS